MHHQTMGLRNPGRLQLVMVQNRRKKFLQSCLKSTWQQQLDFADGRTTDIYRVQATVAIHRKSAQRPRGLCAALR